MNRLTTIPPLFLAVCLLLIVGCRTAAPLPTVVPVAVLPPTPVVVHPTPTAAVPPPEPTVPPTPEMGVTPTAQLPSTAAPPTPLVTPLIPLATLPTPCAAPGRIENGLLDSSVAGEPMRYRIYLPPCYGDDGRVYPALYLLGGNIHDDGIWDALGMDEAAEAAFASGRLPPMLIGMPDNGWLANTTTSGPGSYEGFVLNELIPTIEGRTCAWPAAEGRAVGGLSRGGYWSLMMAFRRPDLFRSAAAHSPALIDEFAGAAEDPVVTGVVNDLGDLRIWLDIGERDPYLVEARPLHEALTADGVAHEWRVNPGQHDNAYWQAHLTEYLEWYSGGFPTDRTTLPECER